MPGWELIIKKVVKLSLEAKLLLKNLKEASFRKI